MGGWRLCQLGVEERRAIRDGGIANNAMFFGGATAEIVANNIDFGGWNGSFSYSFTSPWLYRGGNSNQTPNVGVFAFAPNTGGVNIGHGHRTILLGY